jgi:hypothetical protein
MDPTTLFHLLSIFNVLSTYGDAGDGPQHHLRQIRAGQRELELWLPISSQDNK